MSKQQVVSQVSQIPEKLQKLKNQATEKENELIDVVTSLYDSVMDTQRQVVEKISEAPKAINKMAHEKPWIYIGGGTALGFLAGFILGRK